MLLCNARNANTTLPFLYQHKSYASNILRPAPPPHYFLLFNSLCFSSPSANSFARSLVLTWTIQVSSPSPVSLEVVSLTYFSSALYVMFGSTDRFSATFPRGSARIRRRTASVSLCLSSRRCPTPCVVHGLLDFFSSFFSDFSDADTNFNTFARTSCSTSSSVSAPSVKLTCSSFSPSSSVALVVAWAVVEGSGVPPAGVVARLEPPPRLKGVSTPVALVGGFSAASAWETYWSRWRRHQLEVGG